MTDALLIAAIVCALAACWIALADDYADAHNDGARRACRAMLGASARWNGEACEVADGERWRAVRLKTDDM